MSLITPQGHTILAFMQMRFAQTHTHAQNIHVAHIHINIICKQILFRIFKEEPTTFNRGMLLNAGVLEALKADNYTCFVFQDVDLIPLNDHNLYRCGKQPKHLSVALNKWNYT